MCSSQYYKAHVYLWVNSTTIFSWVNDILRKYANLNVSEFFKPPYEKVYITINWWQSLVYDYGKNFKLTGWRSNQVDDDDNDDDLVFYVSFKIV